MAEEKKKGSNRTPKGTGRKSVYDKHAAGALKIGPLAKQHLRHIKDPNPPQLHKGSGD